MKNIHIVILHSILLFHFHLSFSTQIDVYPGEDLQQAIDNANGGDMIVIHGGTYGPISITNRRFTEFAPLIIKKGDATPTVKNSSISSGRAVYLSNVEYIAFDGLKIEGGMWGFHAFDADHIILINAEITGQGQEGIQARNGCQYLDIINVTIHDIGLYNPQWGEGIYLGGDQGGNEYLRVENCTIYECGRGEAINVKSGSCKFVTITGNYIHDIHPGTTSQWNGGAIGVDQHNSAEDKKIWIQENTIDSVYGGETTNGNTGIMVQQVGARVINNTIRNCNDFGLWFNNYNSDAKCWHYGNTFSGNGQDIRISSGAAVGNEDTGLSPYPAQSWYGTENYPLTITTFEIPAALSSMPYNALIDAAGGDGSYNWNLLDGSLPEGINGYDSLDIYKLIGIPQNHGMYEFEIEVRDSTASQNRTFNLHVANADTSNLANHLTYLDDSGNLNPTNRINGLWDGNYSGEDQSGWPGNSVIDSFWVEYDLGKVMQLSEMRLFGDAGGTWVCKEYSVFIRNNVADEWTILVDGENCFGDEWFDTDVNIETRYVKLLVVGDTAIHRTQVREFEVYSKLNHKKIILNVLPEGAGSVAGQGYHLMDSTVTIEAIPSDGFEFDGWYNQSEDLISDQQVYDLVLEEDIYLTARFSEIPIHIRNVTGELEKILCIPNPISLQGQIHLKLKTAETDGGEYTVKIHSITGELLYQSAGWSKHIRIPVSDFTGNKGVFILVVSGNSYTSVKKLIVR